MRIRYIYYMIAVTVSLLVLGLSPQANVPRPIIGIAAFYWGTFLLKMYFEGFFPKFRKWTDQWRDYKLS